MVDLKVDNWMEGMNQALPDARTQICEIVYSFVWCGSMTINVLVHTFIAEFCKVNTLFHLRTNSMEAHPNPCSAKGMRANRWRGIWIG